MISQENREFIDFLFSKVAPMCDELDLADNDDIMVASDLEEVHQFCLEFE